MWCGQSYIPASCVHLLAYCKYNRDRIRIAIQTAQASHLNHIAQLINAMIDKCVDIFKSLSFSNWLTEQKYCLLVLKVILPGRCDVGEPLSLHCTPQRRVCGDVSHITSGGGLGGHYLRRWFGRHLLKRFESRSLYTGIISLGPSLCRQSSVKSPIVMHVIERLSEHLTYVS